MFYHQNIFVEYFDPAPVLFADRKVPYSDGQTGIGDTVVAIDFGTRSWKNLVPWLHMCRKGECIGWSAEVQGNDDDAEDNMLQGLFDVAVESPSNCPEVLDFVLQAMRPALMSLNPDWAFD